MKRLFLVASVLLLAGNCWAQSEALDTSRRSIFSRYAPGDRGMGIPPGSGSGPGGGIQLPPVPVFVGVILANDQFTGFVMTGDTTRQVAVGDIVGDSRVLQITMDSLYLSNGAVIGVGYDLQNHLAPFNAGPNVTRTTGRFAPNSTALQRTFPRPARGN